MEQAAFNFLAAVTVLSDFGAQENKICHYFHFFSSIGHAVMVLDAMILAFLSAEESVFSNRGAEEDSSGSLGLQGNQTSQS